MTYTVYKTTSVDQDVYLKHNSNTSSRFHFNMTRNNKNTRSLKQLTHFWSTKKIPDHKCKKKRKSKNRISKNIQNTSKVPSFVKQYPQTVGFCWPGGSSRDVDPIVNSNTRPCGHFTGCTIKTKIKQQRMEERNKHGFRTANEGSEVVTLKHSCMYFYGYCDNTAKILLNNQKCWLIVQTFQLPSESHS